MQRAKHCAVDCLNPFPANSPLTGLSVNNSENPSSRLAQCGLPNDFFGPLIQSLAVGLGCHVAEQIPDSARQTHPIPSAIPANMVQLIQWLFKKARWQPARVRARMRV